MSNSGSESTVNSQGGGTESAGLALALAETGRNFYERGWMLGTSGNLSAVLSRDPLQLTITASGVEKGRLTADHILHVDARGRVAGGSGRPSDETKLHLSIVSLRGAGAVFHTHSVWGTIVSESYAAQGGLSIEGFEMLKGLNGVRTHEHREWLPIIENSQDMGRLAATLERTLEEHPRSHGLLIHRHGLYTWGADVREARRHVEILEFLLEAVGRMNCPAALAS